MLTLLHESYMGAEKTKSRAAGALFWPNMTAAIEQTVVNCSVCLSHRNAQPKEPLRPHPIPELAWQKVGADVFTYQRKDYLLVVYYYSKYPEVVEIEDNTATRIVTNMKDVSAHHGIPEDLMSDNMPFDSQVFGRFTRKWGIKQSTSSPGFVQSNGQSECFI